ncbi:hypothetical protein [Conchiformibius kuhniae]|uniref:MerR family transcriptional regulator n=1 Tax=Conchiformibius kuhniae TaxID=211502 RepID=A0A8T9MW75_9NEIS|nr:hypothetical protein [Conchiformibius kuhniae]UOP04678.1 hypothetical protein LVJ77_10845 [Conchiformibius kuhniae]
MTNSVKLPPVPAKRYFSLEEVCRLAAVKPAQLAEWQRRHGSIGGRGGSRFTRLDVMKIRQLQHGIADVFTHDGLDADGNPAIGADEMRDELEKILGKIEKTLAN